MLGAAPLAEADGVVLFSGLATNPDIANAVTIARLASSLTEDQSALFTVTRTGTTGALLVVAVSVTETGNVISGTAPTSVRIPSGSIVASASPKDD